MLQEIDLTTMLQEINFTVLFFAYFILSMCLLFREPIAFMLKLMLLFTFLCIVQPLDIFLTDHPLTSFFARKFNEHAANYGFQGNQ